MRITDIAAASPWRALVLAAGAGTRMGGGKLLRAWRNRPLVLGALEAAWAAPVCGVTLVVGSDGGAVGAAAREGAGVRPLTIVDSPDWAQGMSRSLHAGIASLADHVEGVFVFLGDMPRVPHVMAERLALAAAAPGVLAVAPACGGRRGHPAWLSRSLFPDLLAVEGDRAAGPVLDRLGLALALVETDDDGVLFDVDTPDRLEA